MNCLDCFHLKKKGKEIYCKAGYLKDYKGETRIFKFRTFEQLRSLKTLKTQDDERCDAFDSMDEGIALEEEIKRDEIDEQQ